MVLPSEVRSAREIPASLDGYDLRGTRFLSLEGARELLAQARTHGSVSLWLWIESQPYQQLQRLFQALLVPDALVSGCWLLYGDSG